jgi:hypothetical protein
MHDHDIEEINDLPDLIRDDESDDDEHSEIKDFLDPNLPCLGRSIF